MQALFQQAVLQQQNGQLEQAESNYLNCLEQDPLHLESLYNLATVYAQLGQWFTAVEYYQRALAICEEIPAILYNLSMALLNSEQFGAAIHHLQKLITQQPEHGDAQHLLACLLYKTGHNTEAAPHFMAAIALITQKPAEVHFNFAVMLMVQGNYPKAKQQLEQAVRHEDDFFEAHYNLAIVYQQLAEHQAALPHFYQALKAQTQLFAGHYHLVLSLKALGRKQEALAHCQQALALQHNPTLAYLEKILQGQALEEHLPDDFIASLFDQYANHFDQHLLETLSYQVPKQFAEVIKNYATDEKAEGQVLDLGCGSGLVASECARGKKQWVGVDLSAAMLQKAKEKEIYYELIKDNALSFLQKTKESYSLILASDVLTYMAALEPIFQQISEKLMPGGLFLCSIEPSSGQQYQLSDNLRFRHQPAYLEAVAKKNHLIILHQRLMPLRQQENTTVMGKIYCFKK